VLALQEKRDLEDEQQKLMADLEGLKEEQRVLELKH